MYVSKNNNDDNNNDAMNHGKFDVTSVRGNSILCNSTNTYFVSSAHNW